MNVASRLKAGAIRVIPGDPENSYLMHKVEGRSGIVGLRMPFTGEPVPRCRAGSDHETVDRDRRAPQLTDHLIRQELP